MTLTEPEMPPVAAVEHHVVHVARELALALPMYRLTALQYDIWHLMLGTMERGNLVHATLDDLAHKLGTHKTNISPALTRLRECGLLWREGPGTHRINPRVAFRGSIEEWNLALEAVPPDVPDVVLPAYTRRPPRRTSGKAKLFAV